MSSLMVRASSNTGVLCCARVPGAVQKEYRLTSLSSSLRACLAKPGTPPDAVAGELESGAHGSTMTRRFDAAARVREPCTESSRHTS